MSMRADARLPLFVEGDAVGEDLDVQLTQLAPGIVGYAGWSAGETIEGRLLATLKAQRSALKRVLATAPDQDEGDE